MLSQEYFVKNRFRYFVEIPPVKKSNNDILDSSDDPKQDPQPLSPIFVAIGCGGLAFIGRRQRTFLFIKNVYYCF